MPEAITIAEEQTPALSPEQELEQKDEALNQEAAEQEPVKFAGKYKSVEDLEKGYQELQRKLSEQPKEQEEVSESEETESTGSAKEIYGDYIGSRLDDAGVDYQGMNTRWQESGQLTDEDYSSLEDAGFTKDMVEAYLSGVQFRASQDSALATKEVINIKNEFGGEKTYDEMIQWAAGNLEKEEIAAFNTMIQTSNPHQIRIAVAGIQSAYMNSGEREPKLVGGKSPKAPSTKFESTAQVVAAMNDERYQTDEAFRREIQEKLSRSSVF